MLRLKSLLYIGLCSLVLMPNFSLPVLANPTELEVNAQRFSPMPIAVPAFNGADAGLSTKMREILVNNLQESGLFQVVNPSSYLEKPTLNQVPDPANWQHLRVAALVVAEVTKSGNDINLAFRLWDSSTGQQLFGQQFKGNQNVSRRLAHKMSDAVYTQLTGEGPYFDSQIVFVDEAGPKSRRSKRLAVMDQDGANVRYLSSRNEYIMNPRYSAKAQRIVFTTLGKSSSALHLMDPSTGRREKLIEYQDRMAFSPALSPDGQNVALSVESAGNTDIYVYNIPTRRMYALTSGFSIDTSPSFSPDGQMIVFNSDRGGSQQLYTVPVSGGTPKRISYAAGRYATPVWSPKGDKIAFTKMGGGKFSIGTISTDGSNERILASSFLDEAPSWAPNGRSLVYFRQVPGASGNTALYRVDISGYVPERKVSTPQDASDPAWSPLLP